MANQQLVEYIKNIKLQGYPEAAVREVLLKNGWQPIDIDTAYIEIKQIENLLQSGAPVAPGATPFQKPVTTISEPAIVNNNKLIEYNSPFSIGLAIVLFGSLLILVNKIITDSGNITSNINGKLIFDAIIILPFLLAAFILHGSFTSTNKKFLIISQPYFLTSAFLLIRLLWDTSAYILNTNATYGVYVVLILIIISLTGITLFVQKYIKN